MSQDRTTQPGFFKSLLAPYSLNNALRKKLLNIQSDVPGFVSTPVLESKTSSSNKTATTGSQQPPVLQKILQN